VNGLHSESWPGGYEEVRDLRHIEYGIEQGMRMVDCGEILKKMRRWRYMRSHGASEI